MKILNHLLPKCAQCNKFVDDLKVEQDFCTLETIFVASCHGDSEIVQIPKHEFLDGLTLQSGLAFQANHLTETKRLEIL